MRLSVVLATVVVAAAAGFSYYQFIADRAGGKGDTAVAQASGAGAPIVQVKVPELTGNAKIGERIFNAKCAACHGKNAAGVEGSGPPFIHPIYRPAHHGDAAFLLAPRNGVRSHHWTFGNMPQIEGVTDGDIKMIIAYVRTLQRANGIN